MGSHDGLISGSSQLTSSYDSRYVLSGSITQTTWDNISGKPNGLVSQSTDLSSLNNFTASFSTASLVTSINNLNAATSSYETTGRNIISSSTQIANLGYTTTASFNSYTASQSTASLVTSITNLNSFTASQYISNSYFATTGSNIFNGNQTISGSLYVSGGISVNSITLNGSQLSATGVLNGSYLFAKNATQQNSVGNGTAVSFATTLNSSGSLINKISNTQVTLTGGQTYKLEATIGRFESTSTWGTFRWYDVTNAAYIGVEGFNETCTSAIAVGSANIAKAIVSPLVNTTYELRQTSVNTITVSAEFAQMEITQITHMVLMFMI